jgi:hypothetical protein
MKENINIVEILKDKPQGTKLYSSACGKCKLEEVDDKSFKISFYNSKFGFMNGGEGYLDKNGKLYDDGECVVFPSKEMRDWSKFAWKKGDVLVSEDGTAHLIFEKFTDDTYTTFIGKYHYANNDYYVSECDSAITDLYTLETENSAQTYINTIEERLGGKLNRESLEIEKAQSEFKDGDIVMSDSGTIVLVRGISLTRKIYYHAYMRNEYIYINQVEGEFFSRISRIKRFATDSEKQQLFDALEKEGKAWDAEKKQIVDLKPKCEFKPFDRCIWKIRNCEGSIWQGSFVSYVDKYGATPMGMSIDEDLVNLIILPYNDQTKHLVGTTDEMEGDDQ